MQALNHLFLLKFLILERKKKTQQLSCKKNSFKLCNRCAETAALWALWCSRCSKTQRPHAYRCMLWKKNNLQSLTHSKIKKKNKGWLRDSQMLGDSSSAQLLSVGADGLVEYWTASCQVDAGVSACLSPSSPRTNAMATSASVCPPPTSCGFRYGKCSCRETCGASATIKNQKTNRLRDCLQRRLPPCFVLLSFLYLLIEVCLTEAFKPVMASLSWFCHRRSSEGVLQLLW